MTQEESKEKCRRHRDNWKKKALALDDLVSKAEVIFRLHDITDSANGIDAERKKIMGGK